MTAWRLVALSCCALLVSSCASGAANSSAAAGTAGVEQSPVPTRVIVTSPPPTTVPLRWVTTSVAVPATSTTTSTTTSPTTTIATTSTSTTSSVVAARGADSGKTSCRAVAYIGDSISLGMTSLEQRLRAVGVTDVRIEISGGRSIVETLPGQENAHDVAARLRSDGFAGCWIIAVGTNDAANIAAGGRRQEIERIASMMSVIGADPVVWLDAATIATDGYWAASNMVAWDATLTSAVTGYRNVTVAPWSTFVRPEWYQTDGVHLLAVGSAARVDFVLSELPRRR